MPKGILGDFLLPSVVDGEGKSQEARLSAKKGSENSNEGAESFND